MKRDRFWSPRMRTETSSPLNSTTRPQHKTESSSSCSNSSSVVILPVNFRNHIYKEAYSSFRSSIDSSSSRAFDRASSLTNKEDEEISQDCNYTTAKQRARIVDKTPISDYSDNLNCPTQTVRRSKDDFFVKESSESSMSKHSKVDNFSAGFDLNEDFNANGMDDCIQPAVAAVSSHDSVIIKVLAKHGVPSGRPVIPLKFEGGLGWKGSAETSAFRATSLSENVSKKALSENQPRQVFTRIDLNVASVEEDVVADGIQYSKKDKSLWIDLNRLYDGEDEFTQPSPPIKTKNTFLVDLNLIADTSIVDPVFVNPGKWDPDFTVHGYSSADMSALQHRVASLQQPKLPFLSQSLPPHIYSSMEAPFCGNFHAGYSHEDNLSTPGSKMDEARQSFFLAKMS